MVALCWAIPAVLALAVGVLVLPEQHVRTALRCALGLWVAATLIALPLLLSRS
jgi:hypothetical protein